MQRLAWLVTLFLLIGTDECAWAGPEDEVADLVRKRTEAFNQGNLDAYVDFYADNAVLTVPTQPFRIEGKEAIRATLAGFFQAFPTRRAVVRHMAVRVYGNGIVAIVNQYHREMTVDRNGLAKTQNTRFSQTWVKQADRWLVVDQHNSLLPISP